jgi:hypothetical protein
VLEVGKPKIKVSAASVSGERTVLGFQRAPFLPYDQMVEGRESRCSRVSFYRGLQN